MIPRKGAWQRKQQIKGGSCLGTNSNRMRPYRALQRYSRFHDNQSTFSHFQTGDNSARLLHHVQCVSLYCHFVLGLPGCGLRHRRPLVVEVCDNKVNGLRPSSFLANIANISGILSAIFMPFFGAMIDYTPHRRRVGMATTAVVIMLIQIIEIGTVLETWFAMAILQGINGFLFQVQMLANWANLPELARTVGEATVTNCTLLVLQVLFSHTLHSSYHVHHDLFRFRRFLHSDSHGSFVGFQLERSTNGSTGTSTQCPLQWNPLFAWMATLSICQGYRSTGSGKLSLFGGYTQCLSDGPNH